MEGTDIIETLQQEIRALKLNQETLQQNQALILSHLKLNGSSNFLPSWTPRPTDAQPTSTAVLEMEENQDFNLPPPKKRRKTITKKVRQGRIEDSVIRGRTYSYPGELVHQKCGNCVR